MAKGGAAPSNAAASGWSRLMMTACLRDNPAGKLLVQGPNVCLEALYLVVIVAHQCHARTPELAVMGVPAQDKEGISRCAYIQLKLV